MFAVVFHCHKIDAFRSSTNKASNDLTNLRYYHIGLRSSHEKDCTQQCFLSRFWVSKWHLKFCNDTLNSESRDMVLPCIEVKRFEEESVFSYTWLLQQTAATS